MSVELPPLPMLDLSRDNLYGYTADQMRAYAAEALKERDQVKSDLLKALEIAEAYLARRVKNTFGEGERNVLPVVRAAIAAAKEQA